MSEGPAYSVEDDGTPPPDTPPPQAAEPPAAPPEPVPETEPEGTVDVQGQKMVPLAALLAERDAGKTLKEKARQVDQVNQWYQQNKPYVDFLQAHPDLLTRQTPAAPQAPATPQVDEGAIELAKTLDLYTAEGQPDAARAAKIRQVMRHEAETVSDARIKPVAQASTRDRANVTFQRALQMKTPDGRTADPQMLSAIYQQAERAGNLEFLTSDEGATAAWALAIGMQAANGPAPQPAPPTQSPIVTESSGSRVVNRPAISEMETRVASIRGISPAKMAEYTKNFRPGELNVLEND